VPLVDVLFAPALAAEVIQVDVVHDLLHLGVGMDTEQAKKRQQYDRRVVKVDPNDKRKKGPNAGSGRKDDKK